MILMRLRWRCRFFAGTRRRAKALEHLPGPTPKYWLPGFMGLIVSRQPHRYATMLAEKFGPIFKFRVLWYHVSLAPPSLPASSQYRMQTTGADAYLHAYGAAICDQEAVDTIMTPVPAADVAAGALMARRRPAARCHHVTAA